MSSALAIAHPNGPSGNQGLQRIESPALTLGGVSSIQTTIDQLKAIRTFVKQELIKGVDFGTIPGTGNKDVLLQPGAQKVAMFYNTYPDFEERRSELGEGHMDVTVITRLVSRSSREIVAMGMGLCSTMESKYRWRKESRACPKCGKADTIIRGKEEYGGGWVCWKNGGCKAKFTDKDPAITGQATGRVENPDIYDQRNTVLKMAMKRSMVSAAISLGCMSELFTQDLDDVYDLPAVQDIAPREAPQESPHRDDGRREVNQAFPLAGGEREATTGPAADPDLQLRSRTGKALFAWVKAAEQRHEVGLLKHINGWSKLMEFPGRMVDWDGEMVAAAHTECVRKLSAFSSADAPSAPIDPARPDWNTFIRDRMDQARKHWKSEMIVAGVPKEQQEHPDFQVPRVEQVVNHFVSLAIENGSLEAADVAKDGKPGSRDPVKAKAAMADLYGQWPDNVRDAIDDYFGQAESALRVKLGMDDEGDPDLADDGQDAETAGTGREPGSDDER